MSVSIIPSRVDSHARVLQVASTFTSRPLARTLQPTIVDAGIADSLAFVEYAQIAEYMLSSAPESPNIIGTLLLVRAEDWLRDDFKSVAPGADPGLSQRARQRLTLGVDDLAKQVAALSSHGKPVWFVLCPSGGWICETDKLTGLCRTYSNLLAARIKNISGLTTVAWPTSLSDAGIHDANTDRLGQIPYTTTAFAELGRHLGEQIARTFIQQSPTATSANNGAELADFLRGLDLHVRMSPVELGDEKHVEKILSTVAAFSLTGEKPDLSRAELDAVLSLECMLISGSDKLGNYGPSGLCAFHVDGNSLIVEALALSCPVLGKQVEYAVISGLAQIAGSRRCPTVVFKFKESGRNQMMLKFLESISEGAPDMRFTLPVGETDARIRETAVAPGSWTLESDSNLLLSESTS